MKIPSSLGALAIALLGFSSAARADLAITYVSMVPDAGAFRYTYNLTVGSTQTANAGNFVTLYDVNGLISSSITPNPLPTGPTGGFDVSVQNTGITPNNPLPYNLIIPDNPNVANITFIRTGTALVGAAGPYQFSFLSTSGIATSLAYFAGQSVASGTGNPAQNNGTTLGPAAVPEPSVTAMLGVVGLLGLGYRKIWRGQKAL